MATYVDGFVVPVPKNKVDRYKSIARRAAKVDPMVALRSE